MSMTPARLLSLAALPGMGDSHRHSNGRFVTVAGQRHHRQGRHPVLRLQGAVLAG